MNLSVASHCLAPPDERSDLIRVGHGQPWPLGTSETCNGFNVAVFSRHADDIDLVVFNEANGQATATFPLNSENHRTGDIWHAELAGNIHGKSYGLRVKGPFSPSGGHRFNPAIPLLDPYAVATRAADNAKAKQDDAVANCLTALFVDERFDWQEDKPPRRPWSETILYEMHVRGFTVDASSGVQNAGKYLGVIGKIPYLKALGVTAVELMPVQDFQDNEVYGQGTAGERRVRNYWGYNPIALFAPKAGYASGEQPDSGLTEFKTMVRALHKAEIEVILDVVFNHTAEGGEGGPTFSFRGLDNSIYYMLSSDKQRYLDYSGCGNTLNCNHPVVRSMILDCLRHWVYQFHVDGFRFDLASVLGRGAEGELLCNPPLLEEIAEDPILRHVKLIAEAWDAGGAFQVGSFPGRRWAEWNCHFRDEVRRFWRGDPHMKGAFATRICGSSDLYQGNLETPLNSINFVTCHDGFTLNDLVSYAKKHNEANGEGNRDGAVENYSENNGHEGPTEDAEIEAARLRQIKNMLVTLFVSRGVPMLLAGDESRRSQRGNNNAYCQDNEISWFDWRLVEHNAELVHFVRRLIDFRRRHPVLREERFYEDSEITWIGPEGGIVDWFGPENCAGCIVDDGAAGGRLSMFFNATRTPCRFRPSARAGEYWRIEIDTSQTSPEEGEGGVADRDWIYVPARATLICSAAK